MDGRLLFLCAMILCISAMTVQCKYQREDSHDGLMKEKETHLHFYFHDIHSGKNPSTVMVAQSNSTIGFKSGTFFGSVWAIDDPLTQGPEPSSKVIGNAQGLYVLSSQDTLSLVMYVDYGFTTGEYNGSSISLFSRNPVLDSSKLTTLSRI